MNSKPPKEQAPLVPIPNSTVLDYNTHSETSPLNGQQPLPQGTADLHRDGSASSSNSPTIPRAAHPQVNPRSCHTCRRRKVKCDKTFPCKNCTRNHAECVFPSPGRAPRRPKITKAPNERETELLKRLRRLEGVVEELSGQVEDDGHSNMSGEKPSPSTSGPPKVEPPDMSREGESKIYPPRTRDEGEDNLKGKWLERFVDLGEGPPRGEDLLRNDFGKLVVREGQSRYITTAFWSDLHAEVEDVRELVDEYSHSDYEEEDTPGSVPEDNDSDHHAFVFGYSSANVDLLALHPLPSQIPFYWDTYVENVDPLVKIMHIPTMAKIIKKVKNNLGSLDRSQEALMFSIYFAAVTSLSAEEVKSNFNVDKQYLLRQYRFGTEQALARANFLHAGDIVTVQAFANFLICVRRHDESRFVWSLTGLVIRLAQSLGLHRDGTTLGLSVYDTEIGRRLWWLLCTLDARCAEDFGTDPTILEYSFDCKLPSNYNDADFDRNTVKPPTPHVGVTEMTFCLIRYEICTMSRRINYTSPMGPCHARDVAMTLADKEQLVKDVHEHLEDKYLQYCDISGPLNWVAAIVARLIISKASLIIYGFRDPKKVDELPQHVRDRLFIASIEIMEYSNLLETETSTKKWGWLFHTYVQWHAIAYILREVCVRDRCPVSERGWKAVDSVFGSWGDAVKHSKKNGLLWIPLRKLMAKARRKRQADMEALAAEERERQMASSTWLTMPSESDLAMAAYTGASDAVTDFSTPSTFALPERTSNQDQSQPAFPQQWNQPLTDISSLPKAPQQPILPGMSQVQPSTNPTPWLLDDSALLDLDIGLTDGDIELADIEWDGWDQTVREYQMDLDVKASTADGDRGRGPNVNGMGSWW